MLEFLVVVSLLLSHLLGKSKKEAIQLHLLLRDAIFHTEGNLRKLFLQQIEEKAVTEEHLLSKLLSRFNSLGFLILLTEVHSLHLISKFPLIFLFNLSKLKDGGCRRETLIFILYRLDGDNMDALPFHEGYLPVWAETGPSDS